MKKYLIILALFAAFSSCKKDKPKPVSDLNGTWKMLYRSGPYVKFSNYVTTQYTITNENEYVLTALGNVIARGNFTVNLPNQRDGYRYGTIKFSEVAKSEEFFLKPDTFVVGNISPDSESATYVRIKK